MSPFISPVLRVYYDNSERSETMPGFLVALAIVTDLWLSWFLTSSDILSEVGMRIDVLTPGE